MAAALGEGAGRSHAKIAKPKVGKISHNVAFILAKGIVQAVKNGGFLGFFQFGTPRAEYPAWSDTRVWPGKKDQRKMSSFTSLRNQVAAAFSALALSLVLISGTVTMPTDAANAASPVVIGQLA